MFRIDCNSNDFKWSLQVSHVPAILFIPANSRSNSISYDLSQELSLETILRFILFNSANPLTIQRFFEFNFIKPKTAFDAEPNLTLKSKLRFELLSFITGKLKNVENEVTRLNERISLLNQTNFNQNLFSNDNEHLFDENLKSNLHQSLINRLGSYNEQIGIFKQFIQLFKK